MMRIRVRKVCFVILALLFVQMIFLPKLYMGMKAGFVGVAVLLCLWQENCHIKLTKGRILIFFYVCINILSILHGAAEGYGFKAVRPGTVLVLWPVCFFFLMGIPLRQKQLVWFYKGLLIITFILSVADLLFIFCGNGWIYQITSWFNLNPPRKGYAGHWFLRVDHLYFYAFLTPFAMAAFLDLDVCFWNKHGISQRFVAVTAVLSMLVSVLADMGAIWLACMVGVAVCGKKIFLGIRKRNMMLCMIVAIAFTAVYAMKSYLDMGFVYHILEEVADKFGIGSAVPVKNGSVRMNQAVALLDAWKEAPIWGKGSGYPVVYNRGAGYAAYTDNELQYLVLLCQKGIIGAVSFFSLIGYVFKVLQSEKDIRWLADPFMAGFCGFMAANAFNPYLANLSTLWILFFPFLLGQRDFTKENRCKRMNVGDDDNL